MSIDNRLAKNQVLHTVHGPAKFLITKEASELFNKLQKSAVCVGQFQHVRTSVSNRPSSSTSKGIEANVDSVTR